MTSNLKTVNTGVQDTFVLTEANVRIEAERQTAGSGTGPMYTMRIADMMTLTDIPGWYVEQLAKEFVQSYERQAPGMGAPDPELRNMGELFVHCDVKVPTPQKYGQWMAMQIEREACIEALMRADEATASRSEEMLPKFDQMRLKLAQADQMALNMIEDGADFGTIRLGYLFVQAWILPSMRVPIACNMGAPPDAIQDNEHAWPQIMQVLGRGGATLPKGIDAERTRNKLWQAIDAYTDTWEEASADRFIEAAEVRLPRQIADKRLSKNEESKIAPCSPAQ